VDNLKQKYRQILPMLLVYFEAELLDNTSARAQIENQKDVVGPLVFRVDKAKP